MRATRAGAPSSPAASRRHAVLSPFLVLAGYCLLAVAITWPLVLRLGTAVPCDRDDPVAFTWVLWWNAQALPLTSGWLGAPIFYPSRGGIVFQDSLLGVWPVTAALQRAGVSPLATYNLLLVASFALSAFTAYLLCARLVRDRDAAFCGGLVFGFALYRMAQLSHVNVLLTFWVPLILLGLHAYAETRRARWLGVAAACWALQGLTSGYFLLYASVLVALWALYFVRERGDATRLAVAFGLAFAAIWPWTATYRSVHALYGFTRHASETSLWAADVTGLLEAPPLLALWGHALVSATREDQLFPGLTLVLLCLLAVAGSRYASRPLLSRGSRGCLLGAAACAALAAVVAAAPISLRVLGLRLSMTRVDRPLTWTFLLLLAALALAPPVRRAWRDRSVPAFYALAALATWILALGPGARLLGERVWYKAPYAWLLILPGFDAVRVPARFWLLALLALAVVAAHGLARLARRAPAAARAVLAVACVGLLVEAWPRPLTLLPPPERVPALEARERSVPVLELPMLSVEQNAAAMYRAMFHRAPVVNGHSAFVPASFIALQLGLSSGDGRALVPLAESTALDVLVHTATGSEGSSGQAAMVESLGATLVQQTDRLRLYHLPQQPPLVEPPPGIEVPVARVTVRERDVTLRMTARSSPEFVFADGFEVALPERHRVGEVQVVVPPGPLAISVEGRAGSGPWHELWAGPASERMVRAALADPRYPRLRLRFAPREVDRLRVIVRLRNAGDVIGMRDLRVLE